MTGISKLEYSIRHGNFTRNEDGTYFVRVYDRNFSYIERITASHYAHICDRIRRADWKYTVSNYTAEHSADMSDIMAAYADYQMACAY